MFNKLQLLGVRAATTQHVSQSHSKITVTN